MLTKVDKFLVAVAGIAASAISDGLIVGTAEKWTQLAIAVVTAVGVFLVPNKTETPNGD